MSHMRTFQIFDVASKTGAIGPLQLFVRLFVNVRLRLAQPLGRGAMTQRHLRADGGQPPSEAAGRWSSLGLFDLAVSCGSPFRTAGTTARTALTIDPTTNLIVFGAFYLCQWRGHCPWSIAFDGVH